MGRESSVVLVGRIGGAFGIKGWVKLSSYTQPAENILHYSPWQLRQSGSGEFVSRVTVAEGRVHGKGLVVRLAGIDDRDEADTVKGLEVVVDRQQLPEPEGGLYYWADLEGLTVLSVDGQELGQVDHMLSAGAADVMVVCDSSGNGRQLIPFIRDEVVQSVDLDAGVIRVNWDNEYWQR